MVHFQGTDYRSHTSCISEAQKYQGTDFREKEKKGRRISMNGADHTSQAMVPRRAYVEDAPEGDDSQIMEVVDVPPRAPTPPSATPRGVGEATENVNVFDFLVSDTTPNGSKTAINMPDESRMVEHTAYYGNGAAHLSPYANGGSQYMQYGFSYGNAPIEPAFHRYDSWQDLADAQHSHALMPPPPYVTPLPKEQRRERRDRHATDTSDKKRKPQDQG